MLAFVERYLGDIYRARSDDDIVCILSEICTQLGFRSAYLIEYDGVMKSALHIVDTCPVRADWWVEYAAKGLRQRSAALAEMLAHGGVQKMKADRFTHPDDPLLEFAQHVDMVECTLVPVIDDGVAIGLLSFCGDLVLEPQQQSALQIVCYLLFSQTRSMHNTGISTSRDALTKREKEVLLLSAEGLTSQQIAEELGMAARTVNQHVDNVAAKLGTKNRAHTVAQAIRHGLLD